MLDHQKSIYSRYQLKKKRTIAIIAMILVSLLLWTIFSTLKPRKILKLFLAHTVLYYYIQKCNGYREYFEIEPVCSRKMEYSSSHTLKNIAV